MKNVDAKIIGLPTAFFGGINVFVSSVQNCHKIIKKVDITVPKKFLEWLTQPNVKVLTQWVILDGNVKLF